MGRSIRATEATTNAWEAVSTINMNSLTNQSNGAL